MKMKILTSETQYKIHKKNNPSLKAVVINNEFDFLVIMGQEWEFFGDEPEFAEEYAKSHGGDIKKYVDDMIKKIRYSKGFVYLDKDIYSIYNLMEQHDAKPVVCHYTMDMPPDDPDNITEKPIRKLDVKIPNIVSVTPIVKMGNIPICETPKKDLTDKEKRIKEKLSHRPLFDRH